MEWNRGGTRTRGWRGGAGIGMVQWCMEKKALAARAPPVQLLEDPTVGLQGCVVNQSCLQQHR